MRSRLIETNRLWTVHRCPICGGATRSAYVGETKLLQQQQAQIEDFGRLGLLARLRWLLTGRWPRISRPFIVGNATMLYHYGTLVGGDGPRYLRHNVWLCDACKTAGALPTGEDR